MTILSRESAWCLVAVWTVLAIGCMGDTSPQAPQPPLEEQEGRCSIIAPPPSTNAYTVERVFEHLFDAVEDTFQITQLLASPLEPGFWYLARQTGTITLFDEDPDGAEPVVALDIRDERLFLDNDEAGIVGFAIDPSLRWAVVTYQSPSHSGAIFDSVVGRFDLREDGTIDPDTEVELIRLRQPSFSHAVGHVTFDRDGLLYIGVGDGGPASHRMEAQNPHSFYGSILRIDLREEDPERQLPYSIPADNPFADGVDGAPEVYAYGLRNPWRFSIDEVSGVLWAGDVGEVSREEINRIVPGGNHGWPIFEGEECFQAESCDGEGMVEPVLTYGRDEGRSVTGGFVYRGGRFPDLEGHYIFADYMDGRVWSVPADAESGSAEKTLLVEARIMVVTMAETHSGELLLVRWGQPRLFDERGRGGIYRLVETPQGEDEADVMPGFPERYSETGCADPDNPLLPASGLLPYRPVAELWSDGADKERYVSLPEGTQMGVLPDGTLDFPMNTVLVKHFGFEGRRHETRLYIRHEDVGWRGYTYRWAEDQSDAWWVPEGRNERLPNDVFWRYPSPGQCVNCHTEAAHEVLGLEVAQLLEPSVVEGSSVLESWIDDGHMDADVALDDLRHFVALRALQDDEASLEARARSLLHANCSSCHQPGGEERVSLDLRYRTSLADIGACGVAPVQSLPGTTDEDGIELLVPGDPLRSAIYLRMIHPGAWRMPPLGTYLVDLEGSSVVRAWIESLADCQP